MAMTADEQKALLKQVRDKRISSMIPAASTSMSRNPGESSAAFGKRKNASRMESMNRRVDAEMSKGSDKKLSNKKKALKNYGKK